MKILIVDDEEDARVLLTDLLEAQGYAVVTARNGREALEVAQSSPPDLIISDILMPGMDGFDLCRHIKSDEALRALPFVFYTATYTDSQDEQLAKEVGASHFIVKPMEAVDLIREINGIIEKHQAHQLAIPIQLSKDARALESMHIDVVTRKLEKKIHELEDTIRKLEKSEGKYRRLVESLERDYLIYSHDADGIFTYLSPSIENVLGYKQDEFLTHYSKYYTDNTINEAAIEHTEASIRGEQQPPYESEIRCKNGSLRRLEVLEKPVFDEHGQVVAVEGIAHDITESKRAEEALRESEERTRLIVNTALDAVIAMDEDGIVIGWNPRAEETFGYSQDEAVGVKLATLIIPPESRAAHEKGIAHFLATGEGPFVNTRMETIALRQNGEEFPVEISIALLSIRGKHVFSGFVHDISERKQAEEEKTGLEAQLQQGQKLQAVGELAGGIAHDFNNLLMVVSGYSEILDAGLPAESDLRNGLVTIDEVVELGAALTRQLLAFSSRQLIQPQILDLGETIKGLERMLRRLICEDIELQVRLDARPGFVSADPGQVEQIVLNLALNARDAMPEGGLLEISTRQEPVEPTDVGGRGRELGGHVVLTVADSGIGMDAATQARIFEPFFTTKQVGKGTGLGLATVYGIVQQNDGSIDVRSTPGQGTVFEIYLPRIEEAFLAEELTREEPDDAEQKTATVLVVEDERAVRDLLCASLESWGYTTLAASDGIEALDASERCPDRIDLLLTDVVLPRLGGPDLSERIRVARPEMKVIFISGYSERAGKSGDVLPPHAAYLEKPFGLAELLKQLRKALC